jgi:hypothetical protein
LSPPQPASANGRKSQPNRQRRIKVSIFSPGCPVVGRPKGEPRTLHAISPPAKHPNHFPILPLPPVLVNHENGPNRGRDPSHQSELQAETKRRLKHAPVKQEGEPGEQHSESDHRQSLEARGLSRARFTTAGHRNFVPIARRSFKPKHPTGAYPWGSMGDSPLRGCGLLFHPKIAQLKLRVSL